MKTKAATYFKQQHSDVFLTADAVVLLKVRVSKILRQSNTVLQREKKTAEQLFHVAV